MAEIRKITKNGKHVYEDVKFNGVGQNLPDTSKETTRFLRIEFTRENGTQISVLLRQDEVTFVTAQIKRFNEEKLRYRKYKGSQSEQG